MYTIFFIIALAIAFILKGSKVSNKVMAVVVFVLGLTCFELPEWGWRFAFVVITLCACSHGTQNRKPTNPEVVIALTLVAMSLVKLIATDWLGCYPSWLFNALALGGSVVYVLNNIKR